MPTEDHLRRAALGINELMAAAATGHLGEAEARIGIPEKKLTLISCSDSHHNSSDLFRAPNFANFE